MSIADVCNADMGTDFVAEREIGFGFNGN